MDIPKLKMVIAELSNGFDGKLFETPSIPEETEIKDLEEVMEDYNPIIKKLRKVCYKYMEGYPKLTRHFLIKKIDGTYMYNGEEGTLVKLK
jgi:hypothetical protein